MAVLVSGDPGLFSLARRVIDRFGISRCQVIPAVSSVQTAFARLGLDWQDAKIISAHHVLPEHSELHYGNVSKIAILAGHPGIKPWLSDLVNGLDRRVEIVLCENLTLKDEDGYTPWRLAKRQRYEEAVALLAAAHRKRSIPVGPKARCPRNQ